MNLIWILIIGCVIIVCTFIICVAVWLAFYQIKKESER